MKRIAAVLALGLLLSLGACARHKVMPVHAAPAVQSGDLMGNPKAVNEAQQALSALGYAPGDADGTPGPHTRKAMRSFESDRKLAGDGTLTLALAEKLKSAQQKLTAKSSPEPGVVSFYTGEIGALPNAPADFLQPLKPGAHGRYKFAQSTVNCAVGRFAPVTVQAGSIDALTVVCTQTEGGKRVLERRWSYAPEYRMVIRDETKGPAPHVSELVALLPPTQAWPAPARLGLDWAMTHALEDSAATDAVDWSSTAVPDRFAIAVDHTAAARDDKRRCLHYVIARRAGDLTRRYPGLACEADAQSWEIPGKTPYRIARPASGLPAQAMAAPH